MKKASAIVIYSNATKQIYNLTINHKGNNITLYNYNSPNIQAPNFSNFMAMYEYILTIAKNNGFTFNHYNQFAATWYDISWIDINAPTKIEKFGYRKDV